MEIKDWLESMSSPADMTPLEVKNAYMELSAKYAQITAELADTQSEYNKVLAGHLEGSDIAHNRAKALAMASEPGVKMVKLQGREKATLEVIRSLKRAQNYLENEARNIY